MFISSLLRSSIDNKGRAMVDCLSEFVDYACLGNHEADHGNTAFVENVNSFVQ
jgi:2',3'-cyclic-nucleotide 2'-phosphodiesterase (5'-nucleotidase family)